MIKHSFWNKIRITTSDESNLIAVSSIEKQNPQFYIKEIGHSQPPAGYHHLWISEDYVLHFVSQGSGYFMNSKVSPNSGFLIAPNKLSECKFDENDPWQHYWIRLGGKSVESTLASIGMPLNAHVFEFNHFNDELMSDFNHLIFEKNYYANISLLMISLFYKSISYYVPEISSDENINCFERHLKFAMRFIKDNYSENITVDDIANAANISSKHLYKVFMKKLNQSPKSFLLSFRLEKAKTLLEYKNIPITEIARLVGYDQPNYFSNSFNKAFGISPTEFRNQLHSKSPMENDKKLS